MAKVAPLARAGTGGFDGLETIARAGWLRAGGGRVARDGHRIRGAIDLHAHQDPDSNGPSYGQAARSDDALDLVKRAKAAGMRGFVIKQHLDQTAGLAYYVRKLYPDMEVFGGMGSNFTTLPRTETWNTTAPLKCGELAVSTIKLPAGKTLV